MKKHLLSILSLTLVVTANSQTTIVDVTNPITGATWMDRNLGATQAATSNTDAAAFGDLYQWGRATDGHQLVTSGTTAVLSATETPGHADFIVSPNMPMDWLDTPNYNLWQGVSGINNPCPLGYRLPTTTELEAERATWSSQDYIGAFNSVLKLTNPGYRQASNGTLDINQTGYYYSSNTENSNASYLAFNLSVAGIYSSDRANGMCVRCIKDATAGIKIESNSRFSFYPNPAQSIVTVQTDEVIEQIQIFNSLGELVQTEKQTSFSIEQLPSGFYIIQLQTVQGSFNSRFIKE